MKEIVPSGDNLREELSRQLVKTFAEYLDKDQDTSVSQEQIKAYEMVINEIPEGKLKEFAENFKQMQAFSSKVNEAMIEIQDRTWGLARGIVLARLPLAALIPDRPFTKIAVKSARLSGNLSRKFLETAVRFFDRTK